MKVTIPEAVHELCSALPEVEEVQSHSRPNFRVNGKAFAIYSLNHHGDGRVALLLNSPNGAQEHYTALQPEYYFVPPYVGGKGWLGVELNTGIKWSAVAERVYEAYAKLAPAELCKGLSGPPKCAKPTVKMKPEEINPFLRKAAKKKLDKLGSLCENLPETSLTEQFGNPAWKAGKKTFVCANHYSGGLALQFWVGLENQAALTMEPRFTVPAYTGKNGWINLDVEKQIDWAEVEALLMDSYRHFALQRMLKLL